MSSASHSNSSVCLISDYALRDRNNKSFFVGRVERMVLKKDSKKIEYRQPESFNSKNASYISILLSIYQSDNDDFNENTTLVKVPFKDVICEVNLVVENEKLILSEASRKAATDFVERFCEKQSKKAQEFF